jgi:hypothetical protein
MIKDEIDFKRAKVFALVYLQASVSQGIARIHPDIHGLYETWEAASAAQQSKMNPKDYYICNALWRKPE